MAVPPHTVSQAGRKRLLGIVFLVYAIIVIATRGPFGVNEHAITDANLVIIGIALGLMVLGVAWRGLSTCWVGGRKNYELVEAGPYSFSRNPLYLGWIAGLVGMGLLHGSILLAIGMGVCSLLIFRNTIKREEQHLTQRFGESFAAYCQKVPRWGGRIRISEWVRPQSISRPLVRKTLLEGATIFAAIPLEALSWWVHYSATTRAWAAYFVGG